MARAKGQQKRGPYAAILAELALIKADLRNHLSSHDKEAAALHEQLEALREEQQGLETRLGEVEDGIRRLEGAIALLRWAIPLALSLALFLLDRLLLR